ncbi:hypothetical protein ACP4OV_024701 [Aristida adscensionis]
MSCRARRRDEGVVQQGLSGGSGRSSWKEAAADPDPEPIIVVAGLDREAQEVGEAAGVQVLGVDDGATGLKTVAGDVNRGMAAPNPRAALETRI